MTNLQTINACTNEQFIDFFGGIFEHSPWIAQTAASSRPFDTLQAVFDRMQNIVEESPYEDQLILILKHPELGTRLAMSESSVAEQAGAGLKALNTMEFEKMTQLNKQYTEKFNFPFIIAVAGLDKHQIMKEMERRLQLDVETEFKTALHEIYKIAHIRFTAIIDQLAIS